MHKGIAAYEEEMQRHVSALRTWQQRPADIGDEQAVMIEMHLLSCALYVRKMDEHDLLKDKKPNQKNITIGGCKAENLLNICNVMIHSRTLTTDAVSVAGSIVVESDHQGPMTIPFDKLVSAFADYDILNLLVRLHDRVHSRIASRPSPSSRQDRSTGLPGRQFRFSGVTPRTTLHGPRQRLNVTPPGQTRPVRRASCLIRSSRVAIFRLGSASSPLLRRVWVQIFAASWRMSAMSACMMSVIASLRVIDASSSSLRLASCQASRR